MTWGMVGAASIAVVGSAVVGSMSAGATAGQSVQASEAAIRANVKNTIRTGYRMGLANMQRGLQKRQAVQQGYEITAEGLSAEGAVTANAAASGSIGSSVDAAVQDVNMKVGEALVANQEQNLIDAQNYNTQLEGIAFEGLDAVVEAPEVDIPSTGDIWGNALLAGASSLATSYFSNKMKLGLGSKPNVPSTSGFSTGVGSGFNSANWGMK